MAAPFSPKAVYPGITGDFLDLARQLRKIYKRVLYARQSLKRMTDRIEIVSGTFEFFGEAMTRAVKIEKLAQLFRRHGNLKIKVENASQQLVIRLRDIKDIFQFLIRDKPINLTDRCIAQYQWHRKSKKIVPVLFQDMEVLESSMKTIGILANTHILLHEYQANGSKDLWKQIKFSQTMLNVEFQKLEYARRGQEDLFQQHGLSRSRSLEPKLFSRNVTRFLKTEITKLPRNEPARYSLATINSRSPSDSPGPESFVSVSPPSMPPSLSGGSEEFENERDTEEISIPRQRVHRRRTRSEPPRHNSPLWSSSSSLETVAEVEIQDEGIPVQELHGQNGNRDQGKQGAYVQVPPDGSLKYGPRPKAGRTSPDFSGPSSSRLEQQENSTRRQSRPHSNSRRKNRSDISTYGDDGEVTPHHLTGFIGLPPGSRKSRNRGNQ